VPPALKAFQQHGQDPATRGPAIAALDHMLAGFLRDAEDREKWRVYILKHMLGDVEDPDPKPVERMLSFFEGLRRQGYLAEPPNPGVVECRPTKTLAGKSSFRLTNQRLTKVGVHRVVAFDLSSLD